MPGREGLREQVRRRLANKELFLVNYTGRPERGSGNSCAVCATMIHTSEIQYTVSGSMRTVVAHLACYLVWRQESEAARLREER